MDLYNEVFKAVALLAILVSGVVMRFSPQKRWINRACGITTLSEKRQNLVRVLTQGPVGTRQYHVLLALHAHPLCCRSADRLITHRYRPGTAPALPLPDCSAPGACRCAFQKTIERRRSERRGQASADLPFPDRRQGPDRRGDGR
jgi:hypothetical protein